MLKFNKIKMAFLLAVTLLFLTNITIAQSKVAFIGSGAPPEGDAKDSLLIAYLSESYEVTVVDDDSIMSGVFTSDDLAMHDFGFVSESASGWRLKNSGDFYKLAVVPMFYTELYASDRRTTGWVSATGVFGALDDSTGEGKTIRIVDNGSHQLTAGFPYNYELDVVSGPAEGDESLWTLTYSIPEVETIPIAVSTMNDSLSIVFGVEAGTQLFDRAGTGALDDSLVSINRSAAVGVFSTANQNITDDGFALIDAGIAWILNKPNDNFMNTAMSKRTSAFTALFHATPSADSVDGVLGFSQTLPGSYGDLSIKILFANDGFVKANNGSGYEAIEEFAYEAGKRYAIKVVGNILDQQYSVWVKGKLIGDNFAFAPGPGEVDTLQWRTVKMSFGNWGGNEGMVKVENFQIGYPDGNNITAQLEPQTESFMLEFDAKPTADLLDGVIGFSQNKPGDQSDYSQPIKLLFSNQGFFLARDTTSYTAISEFAYTGGTTYNVRMVFDMPEQTYDVWIAPDGGKPVRIADDFGFAMDETVDTIQWRTQIMSFGGAWGGAVGFVEITSFVISDAPGKMVAFIGSGAPPEGDPKDSLLIAYLSETYEVTVVDDDSVKNGTFTSDDLKAHDFGFVSESASGWRLKNSGDFYKLADVPMFYTELYASDAKTTGWVSATGVYGTIDDSTGMGTKVKIVDDSGHPLTAGFANGSEVMLVSGPADGDESLSTLTFSIPEVNHIPIAVWAGDETLSVIFGVEVDTELFDRDGTAMQDSLRTKKRSAAVGIFSSANNNITEDGFKLIDAGIEWILSKDVPTDIKVIESGIPETYAIEQNYPNPFNPSTIINFSIPTSGLVNIKVFDILGQEVAELINEVKSAGSYQVDFNAANLSSGMYIYRISSGKFNATKKMMLLK
ncbi:MAG: T9SS type A sorting domain-containing protein [Melioribacteraceae bacterium]|nr:T9SS type A sorting domain-containing protein [Melioribacteraceae bacterium]